MNLASAFLILLLGGWFWGRIFKKTGLPDVLGMTLWGLAIRWFLSPWWPQEIADISPFLKSLALVVILLRAGLGLRRKTLANIGGTAILLATIPMLLEALTWFFLSQVFLGLPWGSAAVLAFIISAVSPAVVVPSMLDLQEKGLGKDKEVPTLILAGASLDDVLAITFFSLFFGMAQGQEVSLVSGAGSLGWSLTAGLGLGAIMGFLLVWVFRRYHKSIRATEKTLILLCFALGIHQVGAAAQVASLLGIMAAGFILLEKAPGVARELASKLSKAWVPAAIVLFVLIGLDMDLRSVLGQSPQTLLTGLGLLVAGLISRSAGVFLATSFSKLGFKEKLFTVISYLPKATVQAALGSLALEAGLPGGKDILSMAVLSIILTAPLGLLGIRLFGAKLLSSAIDTDREGSV
jgi:NhaP-type Na+/H+ or K+/H+ antiporter